jgi:small ligand-binding sensory domain FIST
MVANPHEPMRWASVVSENADSRHAAQEAASAVAAQLDGVPPDAAFVFFSGHHRANAVDLVEAITDTLLPRHWIGCSGGGIIGGGHEVEERPGLSITAARLPGVAAHTFRLEAGDLPDPDAPPRAWEAALGVAAAARPHFVVLADPFSFPADDLVRGLDYAFPASAKAGGLASAADRPGQNVLVVDGEVLRSGAVGLALTGAIVVDTIVAQGCRAIGDPMRVTRAQDNLIVELDGRAPLEVLRELLPRLSDRDQRLARSALFLGVATDPLVDEPQPSADAYLIRNILGVNPDNGALAVGDEPRAGQSVRFHLRDALASAEDLETHMGRYAQTVPPAGALLFSCMGRGQNLYGRPDHDTDLFREKVGDVPLGGFFANGEIGSVGGTTHLHGFTSSFALFRAPGPAA